MVSTRFVQTLSEMAAPVLTAFLNTQPADPSKQPLAAESVVWLKKQAKEAGQMVHEKEQKRFWRQVRRVEEFLTGRQPQEKALAIFAGSGTWKIVPLQMHVENELHWGHPGTTQLLWLLNENKPQCVVAIDHNAARFFRYWGGEMEKIAERKFAVDISQWKTKQMGQEAGQGIKKARGAQHDSYQDRMEAQYKHFCRDAAAQARKLAETEKLQAIFLVGSDRLTMPMEAEFPKSWRERVARVKEDFGKLSLPNLQERLGPRIAEWERTSEQKLVENLLAEERKAVIGLDETLAQLQKGKMRTVVLASTVHGDLHECIECGWIDRSADPVCPVCGRERRTVELRETLPTLARSNNTGIQVVSGMAAEQLSQSGGMGGWLRGRTQAQLR